MTNFFLELEQKDLRIWERLTRQIIVKNACELMAPRKTKARLGLYFLHKEKMAVCVGSFFKIKTI